MEKRASTMTRRAFAKLAGAGAAVLSLGGLMAGCADGGSGDADGKARPPHPRSPTRSPSTWARSPRTASIR